MVVMERKLTTKSTIPTGAPGRGCEDLEAAASFQALAAAEGVSFVENRVQLSCLFDFFRLPDLLEGLSIFSVNLHEISLVY